ncbi:MAG: hypothetical protein AABX80_01535 [Nanoarchaeota archaeon]
MGLENITNFMMNESTIDKLIFTTLGLTATINTISAGVSSLASFYTSDYAEGMKLGTSALGFGLLSLFGYLKTYKSFKGEDF